MANPNEVVGGEVPAEVEGAAAQGGTGETEEEEKVFPGGLGGEGRQGIVHRAERVFAQVQGRVGRASKGWVDGGCQGTID